MAAFEWSHKSERKAAVLLIFCDSEPDTADGKVEYLSSGPAVVGYPHQTHLASSRMEISWLSQETKRPQISLLSTFFLNAFVVVY